MFYLVYPKRNCRTKVGSYNVSHSVFVPFSKILLDEIINNRKTQSLILIYAELFVFEQVNIVYGLKPLAY